MALNTSQSQLRHNFTLRVSTELIESRILSSIYILLTLAYRYHHKFVLVHIARMQLSAIKRTSYRIGPRTVLCGNT